MIIYKKLTGLVLSSKRLKVKKPLHLFLAVIFLTMSVLLWKLVNGPVKGNIAVKAAEVYEQTPVNKDKNYKGKYFDLTYPYNFNEKPKNSTNGFLESLLLAEASGKSQVISVNVTEGSTDKSSHVQYRKTYPNLYKNSTIKVAGKTYLIFERTDQEWEKSAFLGDVNKTINLVLTDYQGKSQDNIFDDLLKNLSVKI